MKLRHLILMLLIGLLTTVITAQDIETFTSEFVGGLIIDYPSDWLAYDSTEDFVTTVAREEVSIADDLTPGQVALLWLTPQALDFINLPSFSADAALQALLGEIPPNAIVADFLSEYGDGTRYDFGLDDEMSFIVVTFDRDNVPLIAIIGMNDSEPSDVDELLEVIKTARYTEGAFDGDSILLSQLIIDPTLGYTYEIPASWGFLDTFSYEIRGTNDIGTILLLNQETLAEPDAVVNFDTMIQAELELVAEAMADQTEVVVEEGDDINGYPTREVVMILSEPSEDGMIPAFDYRFVMVDYGNNHVLLSAMYSDVLNSTEIYLPVLRAIAETFYYAPIYPLEEQVEHAGFVVPYPTGYEVDTNADNQIVFTSDDTIITLSNEAQSIETYGDVGGESLITFANSVAQELTGDDLAMAQSVDIGLDPVAFILTYPTDSMLTTYLFVSDGKSSNIVLVAEHSEENFETVREEIEAMASQLTTAE